MCRIVIWYNEDTSGFLVVPFELVDFDNLFEFGRLSNVCSLISLGPFTVIRGGLCT